MLPHNQLTRDDWALFFIFIERQLFKASGILKESSDRFGSLTAAK